MKKSSRRQFIGDSGKTALAASSIIFAVTKSGIMPANNIFVHHVYFWLNNPDSKDDRNKLIEGLKKLSKVKTIKFFHIGQPAGTTREVIDRSYAISWLAFFDTKAEQDSYQTDTIHLKFVEECSRLWTKVIVYDSIDV